MTDVPDWGGVTSSYTRKLAAGSTAGVLTNVDVPLQVTDKSLVIVVGALASNMRVQVVGDQTGLNYGLADVATGSSERTVMIPAFGSADTSVTVSFTSANFPCPFVILATDDEAVQLASNIPSEVANPSGQLIEAGDTDGTTEQGAHAVLNASNVNLIPAPPAGKLNVVDLITFQGQTVAGGVTLRFGSVAGQIFAQLDLAATGSGNPVLQPKMVTSQAVNVQWGAANNLSVNAAWHTIDLPH